MQNVEDDVSVRVNTSRKLDVFSFPFKGGGKRRLKRSLARVFILLF